MLAALSFVPLHIAYSQTASILPPAKTTYFDKNGKPLAFGTVDFYIPGTTTPKTTWQDAGQTIPNTNPVVLDNAGRSIVLGDGSYRQIVRDKNGNLIWDQVTSSTGSGGGGGGTPTVGDGDPVGIIKIWSGFIAPSQYVFAYGQEFTRASYPELLSAITSQQNVSCTSGSPTLTGISDTSQLSVGSNIESNCLNSGATIISKTTNTVVASSNAIISTTTTARFFPYGNGDGVNTFKLPDLRGRTLAGRDNMGGIASGRLTTNFYGSNPSALGANGGAQNYSLVTSDLPPYTPSGTITNGAITTTLTGSYVVGSTSGGVQGGSTVPNSVLGVGSIGASSSQASSTFVGAAQGGSSTSFSLVQPSQTQNYIIKVIPDSNPNTFFGVASIGGMYGIIECGFGLTCAGNIISAVNSVVPPPTPTTLGGIFKSDAPPNQFAIGVDLAGNLLYGGGYTTVNGQVCAIGGSCTITASAGTITVGNTTIASGSANSILYNNAGVLGGLTTANNAVLITDGAGIPFWATGLPTNVSIPSPVITGGTLAGTFAGTPTFSGVNFITNSNLAQAGAATLKGNPTASTANVQDFTIQGLANSPTPNATNDYLPIYDSATGTIKRVTPQAIAGSSSGTVTSVGTTGCLTGGPITTTGTINFTQDLCANRPMNYFTYGGTPNDTTGVQSALDWCSTTSSCVITCTTGAIYRVNTLNVHSNTTLQNCNFQQISSSLEILSINGVSNVKIIGNRFTGNTVTSGLPAPVSQDRAVVVQSSDQVWIDSNYYTAFGLNDTEVVGSNYVWYRGNYSFGVALGPKFDCSTHIHIDGNTLNHTALYSDTPTASQFAIGFFLSSTSERSCGVSKYVTMVNNTVKDYPYSQAYEIHAGQFVTIANNVADNVSICISANPFIDADLIDHLTITGNVCQAQVDKPIPTSSNGGIVVSGIPSTGVISLVTITGNVLNAFNRAYKDDAVGCISLQAATQVSVTGNSINGCGSNAMAVNTGTLFTATGNMFDTTVANGSVQNGVLLNSSNLIGIVSGNMFTNQSVNINNSGGSTNVRFTGLNNCDGVTTCN